MRTIVLTLALLMTPLSAGHIATLHSRHEHFIPAMLVMRTFMIFASGLPEGILQFMDPPLAASSTFSFDSSGKSRQPNSDQNQDNGSGEEDEDEDCQQEDGDDPSDEESQEDKLIAEAVEAFRKLLFDIGMEIRKRKVKLILVFDLDGTLYRVPFALPEPLSLILSPRQLLNLQQRWFLELAMFHKLHAPRVIVIFNTARALSIVSNGSRDMVEGWIDPEARFSVNVPPVGADVAEPPDLIPFQPFQQGGYTRELGLLGLPSPDALISNTGRVITVTSALADSMLPEQLSRVNQELDRQYQLTLDEVKARHRTDFQNLSFALVASTKSIQHVVTVIKSHRPRYRQAFEKTFYSSERTTAICPGVKNDPRYLAEFITGKNIYLSSVANKGSGLCLLLEMMTSYLLADGTRPEDILEIVFGDGAADIPMLLPQKEVLATSVFPASFLHARNSVFVPFGLTQNFTEPPYWRLSVVSNHNLFERHGAYVKQALNHPKVVRHVAPGLPGLMEPVLSMLKQGR